MSRHLVFVVMFCFLFASVQTSQTMELEIEGGMIPEARYEEQTLSITVRHTETEDQVFLVDTKNDQETLIYSTELGSILLEMVDLSPNQQYLSVVETVDRVRQFSRIVILDLQNDLILLTLEPDTEGMPTSPYWSPDSQKMAYIWYKPYTPEAQLWIYDLVLNNATYLDIDDLAWPIMSFGKVYSWGWQTDSQGLQILDEDTDQVFVVGLNQKLTEVTNVNDVVEPLRSMLEQNKITVDYTGMQKPLDIRDYDDTCGQGYTGLYPDYGGCVISGPHPAVDMSGGPNAIGCGTPLTAICSGVIHGVNQNPDAAANGVCGDNTTSPYGNHGLGWTVVLRCDNIPDAETGGVTYGGTIYTVYAHLSAITSGIVPGALVNKGDSIGQVGSTGYSQAPHLHFQMERDNQPNHPWYWNTNPTIIAYTWNPMYFIQAHQQSCCGCALANQNHGSTTAVPPSLFPFAALGQNSPFTTPMLPAPPPPPVAITEVVPFVAEDAPEPPVAEVVVPDITPPDGALQIGGGGDVVNSLNVTLRLAVTDDRAVSEMRFSGDGRTWSAWEPFTTHRLWQLTDQPQAQAVYAQVKDAAGNVSEEMVATVTAVLNLPPPSSTSYTVAASVMSMGGGRQTSGSYTVLNTIGQPYDTAVLHSNSYQVYSGFESFGVSGGSLVITRHVYLPVLTRP